MRGEGVRAVSKPEITTTQHPDVHKVVAGALDFIHENDVIGFAFVAIAKSGDARINVIALGGSNSNVNSGLDALKAVCTDATRKAYGI